MKIKQLKIINQDQSTEIADIGADADNIDYNDTTVKLKLDELSNDNNRSKSNIADLQTELNTTTSNLALQTSRIDSIVSLEEGSTTGDAELIDGRVSYTGATYNNIGSAIREELGSLFKSGLIKDLRNELTLTGYWKNGIPISTNGFKRSAKITIPYGYNAIVGSGKNIKGNLAIVTFWDNNNNFISEFTGDIASDTDNIEIVNLDLKIPTNAKYMAISCLDTEYINHAEGAIFYLTANPTFTRGKTLQPYSHLFYSDSVVPVEFYDWNNLPANYIFQYSGVSADHMLHCPDNNLRDGFLMTFNATYASTSTTLQVFIPGGSSMARTYDFFFYRIYWNEQWGIWKKIGVDDIDIENLHNASGINNLVTFSSNVCNRDNILLDTICWGEDEEYTTAEKANWATVLIPVVPNHTYIASRIDFFSSYYDRNKKRIRRLDVESATNYSLTIPTEVAYVAYNWKYSSVSPSKYMVIKDGEMPSNEYIPFGVLEIHEHFKQKIIDAVESKEKNAVKINNSSYNINGYLARQWGGLSTEAPSFKTTDWIEITEKGASISGFAKGFNNNIACLAFYDSSKAKISTFSFSNSGEEYQKILPTDVKYIRLSRAGDDTESHATLVYDKTTILQQEIDDLEDRIVEVEDATEFFVDKTGINDGIKHFQSLVDCLFVVQNTEGKKRVYIQSGTYDVLEELGGMEHILQYNTNTHTANDEGVQPWIDNCELIGRGKVILNFLLDDGTPWNNYWLFSCLNVRGNIKIENIEIHSKNCRYSIHDESGSKYPDTYRYYKNVRCFQCENGESGGQAIGSGFSARTRVYFDNCYLKSTSQPWSCHADSGCSFSFNNTIYECVGGNSMSSLRISQNGSGVPLYASIANCWLNHNLEVRCEDTNTAGTSQTEIDIINTNIPALTSRYETVKKQIRSYNTLTNTKTILLDLTPEETTE